MGLKKKMRPTPWQVGGLCMLAMLYVLCLTDQARASDVRIVRDSGPNDIVIEMDNATLEQILQMLATRFGFGADHAAETNTSIRFSGRLQGSLDRILDRVLRHEGHLIIHSAQTSAGISQVILFASQRTAPAVTATAPTGNTQRELTTDSTTRDEAAGHVQPGPLTATAPPPPPSAVTPSAAPAQQMIDPTLRQLEEIGRQVMNVDASRSVDARLSPADGIGAVTSSQAAGTAIDAQQLTQHAVANVQALVGSLRAVCLGSCAGR